MAPFDTNKWYQITLPIYGRRVMVGQPILPPNTTADVSFAITSSTGNEKRWQIYPVEGSRYILRSQVSSPNTYLTIQSDANANDAGRGNIATMRSVLGAHDEIYWKITRFQNNGYMLVNNATGAKWHLHAETPDTVSMTNNITSEQDNQQFLIQSVGPIDNETFSSIQVRDFSNHSCSIVSCSNICSYPLERIHLWPRPHPTSPPAV
jgi:hypothetical protein